MDGWFYIVREREREREHQIDRKATFRREFYARLKPSVFFLFINTTNGLFFKGQPFWLRTKIISFVINHIHPNLNIIQFINPLKYYT